MWWVKTHHLSSPFRERFDMRLPILFLYLATACSYAAATADGKVPLSKSNEEALSAIQSFHSSSFKNNVPLQRKAFEERKKRRRDLVSKSLSKGLKDADLSELIKRNTKKKGVKEKASRLLLDQKKNGLLSKMRKINNQKKQKKSVSGRSHTNQVSKYLPWMKDPSLASRTSNAEIPRIAKEEDEFPIHHYHDDHYNRGLQNINIFDMLEELSMFVASINQTEYSNMVDGLLWLAGEAGNITIPSPEEFCADFNVTTTEDECIDAISAVVTLIEGFVHAPWLIRDVIGYAETVVREVVSWETILDIATGIMSMYGADGTIDGSFDAIKGVMNEASMLISSSSPYDGFLFDIFPLMLATEVLAWDYNFLEELGEYMYELVYYLVETLEYNLVEGFIEIPDGIEFHSDICKILGLVPANITAIISCDYFGDAGLDDNIEIENVEFCVEPDQDMDDYGAELFSVESTFDNSTLWESGFGWIIEDLQYKNSKFDDYNFMALESMTCSLEGRLPAPFQPIVCNEKPSNTFLLNDRERSCEKLQNHKHRDMICENLQSAKLACPSTCCLCGEDSEESFFFRYKNRNGVTVPQTKTCRWLSDKPPEYIKKLCKRNFSPTDLKVARGACPVTCGICEDEDE